MKSVLTILTAAFLMVFFFTSCEKEITGEGRVKLSITDAPVDTDGIEGVYITVTEVHYGKSESEWEKVVLDEPKTYNLLELQRGNSEMMGDFELSAGTYNQIRFLLDSSVEGDESSSESGCYLKMKDGPDINLFVPSGTQSGYKAVGSFDVPVNGTVAITADFDARKSVVKAGNSGKYILKPTIRLIVEDQAGHIAGQMSNVPEGSGVMVYAYADNIYTDTEATEPAAEAVRFPGAITSDAIDEDNNFYLAYLAAGQYDLVVVSTVDGEFSEVLGVIEDVTIESKNRNDLGVIDLTLLTNPE